MATSLDIFDNGGLEIFGDFYKNLTVEDLFGITNGQTDFFGDIGVNGALTMELLATPSAPTITNAGTAGATTYGYKVVATVASTSTDASTEGTTTTGNATLSATNYNIVSWAKVNGATGYKVYRTTGGSTPPMLIATITNGNTVVYNDTDKTSGSSEVPSTTNATGALNVHTLVFVTSYSITGNLVAGADDTYTIGDATYRWKDIFASDTVQLGVVDAADTEPLLHVRKATAGTVNSLANTIAVLENSTTNYLSFLRPANASAGIVFGTPTSNARSWMIMYGDTDATYPDYFELALAGVAAIRYVTGTFIFESATAVQNVGSLARTALDSYMEVSGGTVTGGAGGKLVLLGKSHATKPGRVEAYTPNAAGAADVLRLTIPGMADTTGTVAWTNVDAMTFDQTALIGLSVNNSILKLRGGDSTAGSSATMWLYGKTHATPGLMEFYTPNAAGGAGVKRLTIPGMGDTTGTVAWTNINAMTFDQATTISTTAGVLAINPFTNISLLGSSIKAGQTVIIPLLQLNNYTEMALGNNSFYLLYNAYYDGAYKYRYADAACSMVMQSGQITLSAAAAGAADAALTLGAKIKVDGTGLGFFGVNTVAQQTGMPTPHADYVAGELDTEAEVIVAINLLLAYNRLNRTALNNLGLTTVV